MRAVAPSPATLRSDRSVGSTRISPSARAYSRTEELCPYFAGCLLIPERVLGWIHDDRARRSFDLLRIAKRLTTGAGVSRAVASQRRAQAIPDVCEVLCRLVLLLVVSA